MKLNFLSTQLTLLLISVIFNFSVKAQTALDDISQKSKAAYSVRILDKDYKGPAMQIRRSSDNQLVDVYFDPSGKLSMKSPVSENTVSASTKVLLKDWVENNSAYVSVWYDQSGNANHAIQKNTDYQPRIVNGGSLEVLPNGIATLKMLNAGAGGNGFSLPFSLNGLDNMNVFVVVKQDMTDLVGGHIFGTSGPTGVTPGRLQMHFNNNSSNNTLGIQSSAVYASNRLNILKNTLYSVRFKLSDEDGGSGQVFINGKSSKPITETLVTPLDSTKPTLFRIGSATYNRNFEGLSPEFILYNTAVNDVDANKLMSDQKSYFGTK